MRYCESCSRPIDSSETYAVTPVIAGEPTIECLSCAASLDCTECGELILGDEGGVHRRCERRVPCTKCGLAIDTDESGVHEGCIEPCPDCDDDDESSTPKREETPDAAYPRPRPV